MGTKAARSYENEVINGTFWYAMCRLKFFAATNRIQQLKYVNTTLLGHTSYYISSFDIIQRFK